MITIERHQLLSALTPVVRVTERKNMIPILANVKLVSDGRTLRLIGTDLDIEIVHSAPIADGDAGETTVNARMLLDIIKRLPDGSQVNLAWDDTSMTVKSGRSKFKIGVLPVDTFPSMHADGFTSNVEIEEQMFARIVDHVIVSASQEETQYTLNGAYFCGRDVVATDGKRLSHVTYDGNFGEGVILHRKALGEIKSLCGDGTCDAEFSPSKARFTFSSGAVLTTKLIDGTYPDWMRIMPRQFSSEMLIDRSEMMSALGRISIVQGKSSKGVKLTVDDGLLVMSMTAEGEASEEIQVEYDGDRLEIGFNRQYLSDAISTCEGDIKFQFNGPGDPTLVSGDDASLEIVVMPMRV